MTDNVSIPADVAKRSAADIRWVMSRTDVGGESLARVADLLDPKPPTLHEQVAERLRVTGDLCTGLSEVTADAVLAVVAEAPIEQLIALVGPRFADWLAAQPLVPGFAVERNCPAQRDHDVRLLRGES